MNLRIIGDMILLKFLKTNIRRDGVYDHTFFTSIPRQISEMKTVNWSY